MFLNNLKNNLRKIIGEKYYSAFNFDYDSFQFIEIKKYDNYYLPKTYKILDSSEFITTDGVFRKQEAIKHFKFLFRIANNNNLTISYIDNQKLQEEIVSALKIAGFKKIKIEKINFDKILSILIKTKDLISRYPSGQRIFNAIFLDKKIYFLLTQNGVIKSKTIVSSDILDYDSISEFLNSNELDEKEVYVSGDIEYILEDIKDMFYIFGLKTHITNIWQNIANTKEVIPKIFFLESHKYIKTLSLALPKLPLIRENLHENEISDKNRENKKIATEEKKKIENENAFELSQLSSFKKKDKQNDSKNRKEVKKNIRPIQKEQKISAWTKVKSFFLQEVPSTVIFGEKKETPLKIKKENTKKEQKKTTKKEKRLELKVFKAARVYYLDKKEKTKKALKKERKIKKLPKIFLPKNKIKLFLPKIKKGLSAVKVDRQKDKTDISFKEKIINFLNKGIK